MRRTDLSVVFDACGYVVDDKKGLFREADGECIFIERLKRHVYGMAEHCGRVYMADSFGDCFVMADRPVFLAGILGSPRFFAIHDGLVLLLDVYGRLWAYRLDGTLQGIVFGRGVRHEVVLQRGCVGILSHPETADVLHLRLADTALGMIYSGNVDCMPSFTGDGATCRRNGETLRIEIPGAAPQD